MVPAGQDDAQSTAPGVKIVFSGSEGKPQTLYYFRTDISDDGLKKSGFLKFAEQLGKGDSFIKSASYLPHADSFSRIREFLLDRSQALVQDDSGIPIRFFKPDEWRLRPFGRYLGPIGEFPGRYQKGLNDLFHRSNPPRLDFGVGYRWRPNKFEPPPCREEAVTTSLGEAMLFEGKDVGCDVVDFGQRQGNAGHRRMRCIALKLGTSVPMIVLPCRPLIA